MNHHVGWALEHGADGFDVSRWSPDGDEDATLGERFLGAEPADRVTFSPPYEPVDRFDTNENGEVGLDRPENHRRPRWDFYTRRTPVFGYDDYPTEGRPEPETLALSGRDDSGRLAEAVSGVVACSA